MHISLLILDTSLRTTGYEHAIIVTIVNKDVLSGTKNALLSPFFFVEAHMFS